MEKRFNSSNALAPGNTRYLGCISDWLWREIGRHHLRRKRRVVQVEFKSGGKAYVSTGPVSTPCTYTESGKTVTLVCEGDKTVFTMDDDEALNGPQGGMLGRLTKKKQ